MSEFREFQDDELIVGTRYRVLRLIGVGGMGSVYEVEHVELGKRFVLKALLRELARRDDLVARLRNEWRALARLQHESIVNVTDAGTSASGVPFYVMERLDGETLAAQLKRRRRLHVLEAVALITQVLDALSAAHDIGIIHRDVKPANIFLVAGGGLKLLDFGIAKIADATSVVTARGLAVGTPRYMSPEQARGERVDGRSDVYASGLVLFEMIAGVGPYDDVRDTNELLLAHLVREAPPLSSLVVGVAPELQRILATLLAKDCRARPPARRGAVELRSFAGCYRPVPATDTPTVEANYGAPTIPLGTSNPAAKLESGGPGRENARGALDVASLTDTSVTGPIVDQLTTQVTLTVDTNDALQVELAPNTTYVSIPSFDSSTTLEMAPLVAAYPRRFEGDPADWAYQDGERPERTEILDEFTPPVPVDGVPTRTQVPVADSLPPASVTPPPIANGGGRSRRLGSPRRIALASVATLGLLVWGAFGWALRERPTVLVSPAMSVVPALVPVVPSMPAANAGGAPNAALADRVGGGSRSAVAIPSAGRSAHVPASVPEPQQVGAKAKPVESAQLGPFLRAAAASTAAPRPKSKASRQIIRLPASGL